MTTYAWPWPWAVDSFEMTVEPNQRIFPSAFNPASAQVLDLGGDYWSASLRMPANDRVSGPAVEAFLKRLRGAQNWISLYHLKRPLPRGTMRGGTTASWTTSGAAAMTWTTSGAQAMAWTVGAPYTRQAVAQYATSALLYMLPGYTLQPGDLFGFAANGQTVMYVGDTTLVADGSGQMLVEFAPSARSVIPAFTAITFDRPTVNFRLRDGKPPPVIWTPGRFEGITLDLVEAI